MDNQSLSHSRYNCTYHIVFIPKYRRKAMFGSLRREVGERHKGILLAGAALSGRGGTAVDDKRDETFLRAGSYY